MGAKKEEILKETSGGLDIILKLYPDAIVAVDKRNAKFKVREEKTASASLVEREGTWYVTDFGGDGKPKNAIDCWMHENGCSFKEALDAITDQFQIRTDKMKIRESGAKYSLDKTNTAIEPGIFTDYDSTKLEPSEKDLKDLGKYVTKEAFEELGWKKIGYYKVVKEDGKIHTYKSTETYPIYEINFGEFTKIYQPFNVKKEFRFMYTGKRPKEFICGMEQLEAHVAFKRDLMLDEEVKNKNYKVDKVIICSGETDALSIRSIDIHVLWMNSETQVMTDYQYGQVKKLAHEVYYLGDIDATGKRQSKAWGMKHLGLRIIQLPETLRHRRDWRGNPCKDVRDFFKYYSPYDFRMLLNLAYPFKFWDDLYSFKDGVVVGTRYKFNLAYALNFLAASGFGQIESPASKTGYSFVLVENNIVKEIRIQQVKAFMRKFVEERKLNVEILNLVMRTKDTSESALQNLNIKEINFSRSGRDYQHFFFENQVWKVTAKEISVQDIDEIDGHIWEDQVISPTIKGEKELKPKVMEDFFIVTKDPEDGTYDIEIKDQSNPFFQFLINASRVHWRKEFDNAGLDGQKAYLPLAELKKKNLHLIDGDELGEKDQYDQKLHLINKLHVIGHLLHTHKDPSRSWAVWAMDNRISDISESHGRSGKSITFQALRQMLKSEGENGRNQDLTKKPFLFENVTKHTDYILIDDANYMIDLDYFYAWITGGMTINAKNTKSFTIDYKDSPKIAFTSNYAPRRRDSSTMGRLYFTVYSDYYHDISELHTKARTPLDDLGLRLFEDFTPEQWNEFFNLMAQCVKLYMQFDKINPPMDNVEKRGHLNTMGDAFYHWANDELVLRVNAPGIERSSGVFCPRKELHSNYTEYNKRDKAITMQRFVKKVEAWTKFHGFELNPESVQDSKGRVFQKIEGQKIECFYIEGNKQDSYNEDELPF